MRKVHYFPRYSQKENVVTNNTLLLLLRLMDTSRSLFEQFLGNLAGEADLQFAPQWLHLGQQQKSKQSIVDGYIAQDSIKIAVETKLSASFGIDQLERHLDIFANEDHKLLILLCPTKPQISLAIDSFRARALGRGVEMLVTTFEDIIDVMRRVLTERDDEMMELVGDFEEFCSISNLLPDDKFFMFTPPCGPSHAENESLKLYYCPATRSRRAAAYLGIYANKEVRAIGKIKKVVACTIDLPSKTVLVLSGEPITGDETARILEASRLAPRHGWDVTTGHQFFLCDEWAQTSFRKSSPGGIQGHRMLDLRMEFSGKVPTSVEEIANGLNGKVWQQG